MRNAPAQPQAARAIIDKDRSCLRKLDARGWRDELERLTTLLNPIDWNEWGVILDPPDDYVAVNDQPPDFIGPPAMAPAFDKRQPRRTYIGPPTVRLVEHGDVGSNYHRIHAVEMPALLVQLNAPDDVIMREFERALRKAREKYSPPVASPGPKALNARFDERTFTMWLNNKIVELCELFAWRNGLEAREAEKYSQATLGGWLDFDETKTSRAKDCMERALSAIPALCAQIVQKELNK